MSSDSLMPASVSLSPSWSQPQSSASGFSASSNGVLLQNVDKMADHLLIVVVQQIQHFLSIVRTDLRTSFGHDVKRCKCGRELTTNFTEQKTLNAEDSLYLPQC